MTTEDNNARDQARAQLESIKEMVAALHVDYDMLEELRELQRDSMAGHIAELEELERQANGCADQEEAQQQIHEDPLSVQVRTGWMDPYDMKLDPSEFEILLCTGGPAVRIIGDLDEHYQPENPRIQYQDWGTPWTNYPMTNSEHKAVIEYCQQFYFGG
jgi:hypothetical protein